MKYASIQHFTANAQLCILIKKELNIQSWTKLAYQYGPQFVAEILHRVYGSMLVHLKPKFYKGKLTKKTMERAKQMLYEHRN